MVWLLRLTLALSIPNVWCEVATAHPAACRITNRQGGVESAGSGTLVDVTDDGTAGLVLTCAHLFSDGVGEVIVAFPGRGRHGGVVVAIDREADLAAVEIARPAVVPAAVAMPTDSVQFTAAARYRACGFGGDGRQRCTTGQFVGEAGSPSRVSWKFAGAVRSGDSGGGVFDSQGRLVAVVWGAREGVTYASGGGPLRRFLQRVLGRRTARVLARRPLRLAPAVNCPTGTCPLAPRGGSGSGGGDVIEQTPVGRGPTTGRGRSGDAPAACDCGAALAGLGQRLRTLEQDTQSFARQEQLEPLARASEVQQLAASGQAERESLAQRIAGLAGGGRMGRAAGTAAAGALGVSGPAGWAVVAAGMVGGWWIGRRLRRRSDRASNRAPRNPSPAPGDEEATAAAAATFPDRAEYAGAERVESSSRVTAEVRQPIERDDREARELLRLSQLEGRDPLQDAVAGRLALDRLDAIADGDDDPPRRDWADGLRRELRERFNDVAPTKFRFKAEGGRGKAEGVSS